jgi:glycosyltransferase involved in cell wall biosynthesis
VWILFVGRLQVQKNPIRLIDSYGEYLKYNRLSSLIIVGEGNLKNKVRELVGRKNLQNCVRMLGSLNQKDLSIFYKCSDVMLVTSNFEGMPMSILEALACGLPVVTTDVGEVNRVVINGKSGEVVQNSDPEKIAEKVQLVVKHRDIYSKKNCAECVKMFSPEKIFIKLNENLKILYKNKFS